MRWACCLQTRQAKEMVERPCNVSKLSKLDNCRDKMKINSFALQRQCLASRKWEIMLLVHSGRNARFESESAKA